MPFDLKHSHWVKDVCICFISLLRELIFGKSIFEKVFEIFLIVLNVIMNWMGIIIGQDILRVTRINLDFVEENVLLLFFSIVSIGGIVCIYFDL